MVSAEILTEADYFAFQAAQPDARYELWRGELVPKSPVGYVHARRVFKLTVYLSKHLAPGKYDVLSGDAAIILEQKPLTLRGMDLAVLYKPHKPISGALREPVLLAIEVVSSSDSPMDIERKRMEYEAFGIQEILTVYEDTQTVHVSQPGQSKAHFIATHNDSFRSVLGMDVQVGDLFL